MAYVQGWLVPVRTDKRDAYRKMAAEAAALWKENGAVSVTECWGDDVPEGKVTSFPLAVKLEEGETVVFSWAVWPSKAARDAGMAKVLADPRMRPTGEEPFSMQRMIFGGFEAIVEA